MAAVNARERLPPMSLSEPDTRARRKKLTVILHMLPRIVAGLPKGMPARRHRARPWLLPADVNDDGPLPRAIQLH